MKNLRLKFADSKNYRFSLMCTDLNSLIQIKFPGKIFFVKAEKECLSRFSGSFFGPSNRISGWLIDESEEEIFEICKAHDIPAIVAFGRKGGSNVAASICNALLYSAVDMVDPMKRGWQK